MELTPIAIKAQETIAQFEDNRELDEDVDSFMSSLGGYHGFWYEMTQVRPLESLVRSILASNEDVERVLQAFAVVEEFEEIWSSMTWEY